jgi:8-oxo-dGTP diphosphatase
VPASDLVVVVAAVVEQDGSFLLTRRLEGTHLAGRWEFPGGKCEPGESLEECLRREVLEELGANVRIGAEILVTRHAYPERTVQLHFFGCALLDVAHPREGQEMRWVTRADLSGLDLPEADADLVALLSSGDPRLFPASDS